MTIFASKEAFMELGVEQVNLSSTPVLSDCTICTKPLALHHEHTSPVALSDNYHEAVRIIDCGHLHGKVCLSAWLDTGHSCPTCKRLLFHIAKDAITQEDIDNLLMKLGPVYGARRVTIAAVNYSQKQTVEFAELRRRHEHNVTAQNMEDAVGRSYGFTLSDEDFLDSDGDMEPGEDWEDEGDDEDEVQVDIVDSDIVDDGNAEDPTI